MFMFWRPFTTGVVAALIACTWTAAAGAGEMDQEWRGAGVPSVQPGADGNADALLMAQQGRPGFGMRGLPRFDTRFNVRPFQGFGSRFGKGLSNPLGLAVSPRIARPACRA
jgi:hypothetical protein